MFCGSGGCGGSGGKVEKVEKGEKGKKGDVEAAALEIASSLVQEAEVRQLQQELLVHLAAHQRQIFAKATRKNRAIKVAGDVILGTGGHNPGHIRHYHRGRPGFVLNPLNGKALYILPVSQQARFQKPEMASTVAAYDIACRLLRAFDPDYAAGEFMVQFALMAI